jgi:uncharacterized protein YbjT (DUF2867 family)
MSLVTCDDVAAALAAAALGDRDGVIRLTGPNALTAGQLAEIAGVAAGRRSPTFRLPTRAIADETHLNLLSWVRLHSSASVRHAGWVLNANVQRRPPCLCR